MMTSLQACTQVIAPPLLRRLANIALDSADATRVPCECRECHLGRLSSTGKL
jgi:hypothetical protein